MWAELQKSFKNALLECDNAAASSVLGDGLAPDDRLAIYRHHVFDTLTDTLKCAYPVVCRLVDERFFAHAADQFIRQHPPAGLVCSSTEHHSLSFSATFPRVVSLSIYPMSRD